jgi:hypothetical protein
MDAGEHHKSISGFALYDRGSAIGILGNNITPARKLRPILPVHIKPTGTVQRDCNCLLIDTFAFIRLEVEPHTRGKVHSVVSRISAKESAGTDSQIMQAILCDRVAIVAVAAALRFWPIVIESPPGTMSSL